MYDNSEQRYALITLLPLIIYGADETQALTVRPMTPDDRFGPPPKHGGTEDVAGERLVRAYYIDRKIRARWQVDLVECALEWLFEHDRLLGLAVWWEYVNQWNEYESSRREALANEGVNWMLDHIYERLFPYTPDLPKEKPSKEEVQAERDRGIKQKKKLNWPVKRIAIQYGLTPRRVRQILSSKPGSTPDGEAGDIAMVSRA